jgi:uncharacterized protein (TIGR02453 family)
MAFRGWPAEAIEFYEGLEADNSKTYWTANKTTYDECVRAPMVELLAELEPEFGAGKIFRPYRDVRFSRDKAPYKTAIGALLAGGGYVQLSSSGLAAGCGMYHLDAGQLARFRESVAEEKRGKQIAELVQAARSRGVEVSARESLKTVPRGFDRDHPRAELLKQKGLITWRQWPVGAWLGTAKAKDRVVEFLRDSRPVMEWLNRNVGPADETGSR